MQFNKSLMCLFISTLIFSFNLANAMPARIIIIRHGENPAQGEDLNTKGWERAGALPPYFAGFNTQNRIAAVYAAKPIGAYSSRRSAETCQPTADAFRLPLNIHYSHSQYKELAAAIKKNTVYTNKTVVICWQHEVIPEIAKAFGVTNVPAYWPSNIFDAAWIIDFNRRGHAKLTILSQQLLYGDSNTVIFPKGNNR